MRGKEASGTPELMSLLGGGLVTLSVGLLLVPCRRGEGVFAGVVGVEALLIGIHGVTCRERGDLPGRGLLFLGEEGDGVSGLFQGAGQFEGVGGDGFGGGRIALVVGGIE